MTDMNTLYHFDVSDTNQTLADIGSWKEVPTKLLMQAYSALEDLLGGKDCLVLIDPYLGEPEHVQAVMADAEGQADLSLKQINHLRSQGWGHQCYSIDGGNLRVAVEQTPYLVHLESKHTQYASTLGASLEHAQRERWAAIANGSGAQRIGGWLQLPITDDAIDTLQTWLGTLMQVSRFDVGSTYLRLADSRIIELLHNIHRFTTQSTPALRWAEVLKGIDRWVYLKHDFAIAHIAGQAGEATPVALPLEKMHWQILEHAQAINTTIMHWQKTNAKLPTQPYVKVWRALQNTLSTHPNAPSLQAQAAAQQLRADYP